MTLLSYSPFIYYEFEVNQDVPYVLCALQVWSMKKAMTLVSGYQVWWHKNSVIDMSFWFDKPAEMSISSSLDKLTTRLLHVLQPNFTT